MTTQHHGKFCCKIYRVVSNIITSCGPLILLTIMRLFSKDSKSGYKNKNSVSWWQCKKKKKTWNRNINWKSSEAPLVNIYVWFPCRRMLKELIKCSRIYKMGFGYFVFEYIQGKCQNTFISSDSLMSLLQVFMICFCSRGKAWNPKRHQPKHLQSCGISVACLL